MLSIEINGQKYLLCKLPDQPFSTLHDPDTKEIVGQWNNHTAQHEIFATESEATESKATEGKATESKATEGNPEKDAVAFASTPTMTPQQFDDHIRELIASGAAFTII
jgi:hypothetical protein